MIGPIALSWHDGKRRLLVPVKKARKEGWEFKVQAGFLHHLHGETIPLLAKLAAAACASLGEEAKEEWETTQQSQSLNTQLWMLQGLAKEGRKGLETTQYQEPIIRRARKALARVEEIAAIPNRRASRPEMAEDSGGANEEGGADAG